MVRFITILFAVTVILIVITTFSAAAFGAIIFAIGDMDGDRLSNLDELLQGTKLQAEDSDLDGACDGDEVKMCANPRIPDMDQGIYHSCSLKLSWINVTASGEGNIIPDFRVVEETAEFYTGGIAQVGPTATIFTGDNVDAFDIAVSYGPGYVNPENIAVGYFDDSAGMYLPVDSTVDERSHTVKARLNLREIDQQTIGDLNCMMVTLFDVPSLFEFNKERFYYTPDMVGPNTNVVNVNIRDRVNITDISYGADGKPIIVNNTIRFIPYGNETNWYKKWH